ncbi:MAG: hypothetical protein KY467_04470, partial [Gemmatimonadetes bacterium]|nr:hypothetical protein [Gemmatimonadota bacterium]
MTTTISRQAFGSDAVSVDLLFLHDPRARDPDRVGRKAATLARLLASGFPVPEGFAIPVEACARISKAASDPIPEGLRQAVASGLERLGGGPVAVRSSAAAEDLEGASYAGQYESVLDVRGMDAVCRAITVCVASATSDRLHAYEAAHGSGDGTGMAVLVQRMVPADSAGVAFTANPVTGDRSETLVSAVPGLGERLVAGLATPQEWVVADGTARCTEEADGGITAPQALEVAALAERIEAQLGTPQDIEWAIAGGTVHLLQARPITVLPRPPVVDIPKHATLLKDAVHYPEQF